jgi:hypothetical protein
MRTLFLGILSALLFTLTTVAHDAHYEHLILREWQLKAPDQKIRASFFLCKGDKVWLEKSDGKSEVIDLNRFSEEDQSFIRERLAKIEVLNQNQHPAFSQNGWLNKGHFGMMILGGILGLLLFYWKRNSAASLSVFFGVSLGMGYLLSFKPRETGVAQTATNHLVIDSAFTPFKPKVYTHWDQTWFYVESKGIADHEMMTGITKWQQQVPIPQCYIGANAWQIPLNPVLAANPIPVNNQHFLRGAIALAANGIPIFNPYTNTGVDAFLDGQLDQWGGHSGRADDYHYHIAPVHLYPQSSTSLPIAYGLDGFPVYGSVEPDGSPMQPLDEFHGHVGSNGIFHYHGTPAAPYMIGKMKGEVTEDATLQIIPQPSAHPVRPSGTPLTGATITGFTPNGTGNGYNMTYTLNGGNYAWNYSWTPNNVFTFNYVTPTGTTSTNYNGQAPCSLPTGVKAALDGKAGFRVYPNPASHVVTMELESPRNEAEVVSTSILNVKGQVVNELSGFHKSMNLSQLPKGSYHIRLTLKSGFVTRNLVIE